MKFWAKKVNVKEEQVGLLIRSFFKEFNPKSMIQIKGNIAELEIFFDEHPPQEIIEAISQCGEIEFEYLPNSKEKIKEDFNEKKSTSGTAKENKDEPENSAKSPANEIPDLDNIVNKSNSYEDFIENIAKQLNLEKRHDFFKEVVNTASKLNKISQKKILASLDETGYEYSDYDYTFCNRCVSKKFNGTLGIMQLIKKIIMYRDFDFSVQGASGVKKVVTQKSILDIPNFQKIVDSIDKTQPINERVKSVLTAMGLSSRTNEEQYNVQKVVNIGIKLKNINAEAFAKKCDMSSMDFANARMIISTLLNDNGCSTEKMKVIDFLKELQKLVMTESEIENLT